MTEITGVLCLEDRRRKMGSEDMNLVSSQRMETALNSHRVYQADHMQYRCTPPVVAPRRGDSGRKTRPVGVGGFVESAGKLYPPNDRERYLHQQRNFRNGIYGAEDSRSDGIVVESDSRRGPVNVNVNMNMNMSVNGGLQMRGMVNRNTGGRGNHQDWGDRVAVMGGDGSAGSQTEGSEEDEDEDDDGEGEMDGEVDGMVSVDGRQDSMAGNNNPNTTSTATNNNSSSVQGGSEGFQKSGLERESGIPKAPLQNHHPSLGMFLSPPFLNSFSSPSGAPPMLDATPAQNGGGAVPASSGYYRDGLVKESGLSRDNTNAASLHEHHQARISHGPSIHHEGALPVGSVADTDNYYTQLLQSSGPIAQKDTGVDEGGAFGERKGPVATAESSEPSLRNILSDPLTGALMDDATILSCGHSFGSSGLQHVLDARACFTCGQPVTNDSVSPNHALRAAVQAYRREEEFQSMSSKSAKRRKFEQDRAGFSDPMDYCRGRGVQFPFVVSDRVIIKGNKRTPERFVGREAVITTQCLNGWYVVKTLDNAESVKLQYRSLLKVGDHQPSNEISQKALGPSWL